ncbi:hypothetical protein J7E24_13845 [Hymenobacter sp. ISL-91]|uniref:hypothetical protein n=1 Tax=Hymenobacter sp. ISL-91 TaxID=2819151 RepID=UPI001BEA60BF|nr:hypothetical protein [Hymenobacter sp. ISL-91]MBT2558874.1 hypothetical protein [Hymenobacter sp. ISL-91]
MNDTQRAKLAMLQATLAVLDQHAALYATNQALGKAHDELAALVAALDPTADRQRNAVTPAQPGAVKKQTKQLLAQRAADVAAALLALADEQDDIGLHTDADYTEKQLQRQPDNDLLRIGANLHRRATEHAQPLARQNVTPQELQDLQAALNAFRQELTTPRTAVATGKALKQQIGADLRQANNLLRNRLDKYLLRYQRPQPAFYAAYQSARQTINTAARSEK